MSSLLHIITNHINSKNENGSWKYFNTIDNTQRKPIIVEITNMSHANYITYVIDDMKDDNRDSFLALTLYNNNHIEISEVNANKLNSKQIIDYVLNLYRYLNEKGNKIKLSIGLDISSLPIKVANNQTVIEIELYNLYILKTGQSYYNSLGFYQLNYEQETKDNTKKIHQPITIIYEFLNNYPYHLVLDNIINETSKQLKNRLSERLSERLSGETMKHKEDKAQLNIDDKMKIIENRLIITKGSYDWNIHNNTFIYIEDLLLLKSNLDRLFTLRYRDGSKLMSRQKDDILIMEFVEDLHRYIRSICPNSVRRCLDDYLDIVPLIKKIVSKLVDILKIRYTPEDLVYKDDIESDSSKRVSGGRIQKKRKTSKKHYNKSIKSPKK
jgi:hypothetical protein